MIPENHASKLREMFPLSAHGYTHRDFVDRWHGTLMMFANRVTGLPVPGWPNLMDFSGALLALKTGAHLARESWGDRHHSVHHGGCEGRYIAIQVGYPGGIAVNANTAEATGLPEGSTAVFKPYLIMCTPAGGRPARVHGVKYPPGAPLFDQWQPGGADVLAEDWMIVCRPDDHETHPDVDVRAYGQQPPGELA